MTSNALTTQDGGNLITVLQNSLYPGADGASISMVIEYCRASKLDPLQKPVHIVPMWDKNAGRMRDVIMPGIGLYRIMAARSGEYAGMTEPEFGEDITEKLGGVDITYPAWCKVTAKRLMINGSIAEFTAVERWKENYAIKGGKERSIAPNAMWARRPYAQLAKCATAQALRSAFPELIGAHPTAEEMEGREYEDGMEVVKPEPGTISYLPREKQEVIIATATEIKALMKNEQETDAYALWQNSKFDADETAAFWKLLDAKIRFTLGAMREAENAQNNNTISVPQKKRLEARIGELKVSRDAVKDYCKNTFGKEHFADLTREEYDAVDAELERMATEQQSQQSEQAATPSAIPSAVGSAGLAAITAEQAIKNISKAIDADTLKLASDIARSACKTAPDKAAANAAYVKRLSELKAMADEAEQ